MGQKNLSNTMTVVGLVNGMIGGIILIMPILALNTGTLLIAPITIVSGFFSYFSSLLCLRHLRNFNDLDESILKHFGNNQKYKVFYDIIIVISFLAILLLYFGLMSDMWYGITQQTKLIPILNAIALFPIVYVMKKFNFGASLLAYGILSIIGYCIFLAWMWSQAPKGDKKIPLADPKFIQLAAALAQGFAIQIFFIPILKQNPNRKNYGKLLFTTYAIGCIVYSYIGYTGAASIINLKGMKQQPEQIGDFFRDKQWQVILLEIIYLVHLYSAFPEFLLISKKRFFSIFKWPETEDVTFKEVVYAAAIIFLCLVTKLTSVSPEILIELNGSIVSFFFIYAIPISLHIKCVYFTKHGDRHLKFQEQIQQQNNRQQKHEIQIVDIVKLSSEQQKQSMQQQQNKYSDTDLRDAYTKQQKPYTYQQQQHIQKQAVQISTTQQNNQQSLTNIEQQAQCSCDIHGRGCAQQLCQIIIMIVMVISGLFTMAYTLYELINEATEQ